MEMQTERGLGGGQRQAFSSGALLVGVLMEGEMRVSENEDLGMSVRITKSMKKTSHKITIVGDGRANSLQ